MQTFFCEYYTNGLKTNRDIWCYNFSRAALEKNIRTTIDFYNSHETTDFDSTKIVWSDLAKSNKLRKLKYKFDAAQIVETFYRPFCKSLLYYDENLNDRRGQFPKIFPTGNEENLLICVPGINDKKFSVLMTNKITDVQFQFNGQCFPLYWYSQTRQGNLFGEEYERHDGISDFIMRNARKLYGEAVTKEEIFYYVYGFLHLPSYREKFSADLKKSLPRIFLVDDAKKFWHLVQAGRDLAEIHLHYESQAPAQVDVQCVMRNAQCVMETFRVKKMKLSTDKKTLYYNEFITVKNIPPKSFDYVVNGRSPLEWIIDRYQVKVDKASGITNNPNDWCAEHENPRYILDLVLSSITVSLKTLDIVENLPTVEFE